MTVFGYKIAARAILIALAVLLVVAALLWGPAACRSMKTAGEQAKISKGQEGAAVDSGAEAMNTVSNVAGNSAATDATVEQARARSAPHPKGRRARPQ
jgi:hypothetical protein